MLYSNKYILLLVSIIIYFIVSIHLYYSDKLLHVYFLNVGQGDSTLIITPKKHSVLIDGGPSSNITYELSKHIYPLDKTIDILILTHPHADHLFGLLDVIEEYEVGAIIMSGSVYDNVLYKEFLTKIKEKNINVIWANSKEDIMLDNNILVDILYPLTKQYLSGYKKLNNSSVVAQLRYKNNKILFMGDLEIKGIDVLNQYKDNLKSDILKVSHHGSRNGTTKELLEYVDPKIAIMTYKDGNKFGHPHNETISLLKEKNIKTCVTTKEDCSFNFE